MQHTPKEAGRMQNSHLVEKRESSSWKRFIFPFFLIAMSIVIYSSGIYKHFSYAAFLENRADLQNFVHIHYVQAILIFMAIYIASVALSIPGASFLTISGGFLFGGLVGGTITVIAATIGACIIFFAAKTALGSWFEQKCGVWIQKIGDGFRENAFSYLLSLRLIPIFPFFAVNVAPAFFNISFRTYAITTLLGIIPGTFAFSFLGVGLGSIFESQYADYSACLQSDQAADCKVAFDAASLVTPELLAGFTLLGIVSLIPIMLKKMNIFKS